MNYKMTVELKYNKSNIITHKRNDYNLLNLSKSMVHSSKYTI